MFRRVFAVFALVIFPLMALAHSPLEKAIPTDGAVPVSYTHLTLPTIYSV